MRTTVLIAQTLVRITGLIQIVLGLLIWLGVATNPNLILAHIASGLVFVISIWVLAFASLRSRENPTLAVVTFLYGLLVIALGLYQTVLLVGLAHWVIRALHLLVGLGAMGIAERLSKGLISQGNNKAGVQVQS